MSPPFTSAQAPLWRRAGSGAALAVSLMLALQPSLLLAQLEMNDPDRVQAPASKTTSRQTSTDNVSDDLNRRESQRVEQIMRSMNAPAASGTCVGGLAG